MNFEGMGGIEKKSDLRRGRLETDEMEDKRTDEGGREANIQRNKGREKGE